MTPDLSQRVRGRYFYVDDDTPFFPYPEDFGSRIWTTDNYPDGYPLRGDDRKSKMRRDDGRPPLKKPYPKTIGQLPVDGHEANLEGHCGWTHDEENGAAWDFDGSSATISFEDSLNCGGSNALRQRGRAALVMNLAEAKRLTLTLAGRVERHDMGFDEGTLRVDGEVVAFIQGTGEGLECLMHDESKQAVLDLAAGRHTISLEGDTIDGRYHLDAYFSVEMLWYPPLRETTNQYGGLPYACYTPIKDGPDPNLFFPFDVYAPREWLRFAELMELVYADPAAAAAELGNLMGPTAVVRSDASSSTLIPSTAMARMPGYAVVLIEGTTNAMQAINYAIATFSGQTDFAGMGTNMTWMTAALEVQIRLNLLPIETTDRVLFVGHSYGGAVAAILGARFKIGQPSRVIDVLTFGGAQPGNDKTASVLEACNTVRISNDGDPVPALPPNPIEWPMVYPLVPFPISHGWGWYGQPRRQRRISADGVVAVDEDSTLDVAYLLQAVTHALGGPGLDTPFAHFSSEYTRRLRIVVQNLGG